MRKIRLFETAFDIAEWLNLLCRVQSESVFDGQHSVHCAFGISCKYFCA